MNKNYIIWGISDKGYEDNISSSFPNKIIPAEFKASVNDSHRQYAFAFARENPNDHYFYSIEQVGSDVLYTIYRTNFKGGSVGNRLAYDAATIIISKNHIIEKPLNSLKLLISSYITQKDSGFGNFNFENALAGIRLLANNDKRSISKRYKAGYIKYHSETELSSVLVDKKDKLHNFNKVYFFTRLNLLEQGENKIQDLKDYKAIPIKIINFDARYYRIYVENKQVDVFGESLNVYEGDEIKIYKAKGNTPQNVELAKTGLTITLKKIEPPKPKPQLTGQDIRRKRKNKEKITKYIALALCSVVILVTLGFVFFEKEIQKLINPPKVISQTNIESVEFEIKENYEFVFDGEYFINSKKDTIKDADALLACFEESIYFKDDLVTYKLVFTDENWGISTDKGVSLKVDPLMSLKAKIEKASDPNVTKKIVDHINKVIKYNKLRNEGGLEYDEKIWKIEVIDLMFRKSDSNTEELTKYTKKRNKELEAFLKDNLPKNIFEAIFSNQTEETEKDNKTQTIIVPKEPKVIPSCKTKYKDNFHWNSIDKRLRKYENTDEIKKRDLQLETEVLILKYQECPCKKCAKELDKIYVKKVITWIHETGSIMKIK
tara:strand:+ start:499 stop:2310 length:1812 start_codon:yes stop_codon:yes gene_type:complete